MIANQNASAVVCKELERYDVAAQGNAVSKPDVASSRDSDSAKQPHG
jgi:hypothetical protein